MKKLLLISCLSLVTVTIKAQQTPALGMPTVSSGRVASQPFLFSVNTLTPEMTKWNMQYSGSYGERAVTPFGFNGVDQQLAVKGYLGNRFTLFANASLGFARSGGVNSYQQVEVLRDVLGGRNAFGPRVGLGLGASRDWSNVKSLFSRLAVSFDAASWKIGGNMRFEKAFDKNRDNIDLISSVGFHHRIKGAFFAGIEAVGQDLEGFWDQEEAEGGAKLLIGPSLNVAPVGSRLSFSVCGGPIFYATRSNVAPSAAIRELPSSNGYTVRVQASFALGR
ncbi:hypothetical protein [Mucilaginibacter terrenus]|nr:hypothetical protein [Mucilaginibacter terrenus]